MASEMIERVARAICKAHGVDPDREGNGLDQWRFMWQSFANDARTAIEAMREPTETMIRAGDDAAPGPESGNSAADSAPQWRAMVDAALNPVDVHEILNGRRTVEKHGYGTVYEPREDDDYTVEHLDALARDGLLNGPQGNDVVLRLIELIRAMNGGQYPK